LEEKAASAQLRLDAGEITPPQLPQGNAIPDNELSTDAQQSQLSEREQLIADVNLWVTERFEFDMEAWCAAGFCP
jgi:hypothetical protein